MKKCSLYFIFILFSLKNSLVAQVSTNKELSSFINKSFTYFPKIKEAENLVLSAQQTIDLAALNAPIVDGNISYRFVEPKIEVPLGGTEFQFAPIHNIDGNVSGNYLLFDFGRIKANVEKAKTQLKYSEHNVTFAKFQLASQVATIYYNIVYLHHAIEIQDSVLNFLNNNRIFIQNKYNNGDALKIDILNIETQIDAELNHKVDLQNSLNKEQNLLFYTSGNRIASGLSFDFELPLLDAANALTEAGSKNPEFALANDKIAQAKADVEIAKLNMKPSVTVGAQVGTKNGYVPEVNTIRFNYNAGFALKVPIYEGGRTKKQVVQSQTLVKQSELAEETLKSSYHKDIEQALEDIISNTERIKNTEGQIGQAKYAKTLAENRFKNGVGTNIELTNASTNVRRAELTKLQYQYQLCLAKVELARLIGYTYW